MTVADVERFGEACVVRGNRVVAHLEAVDVRDVH